MYDGRRADVRTGLAGPREWLGSWRGVRELNRKR